jgi:phosphohistidine phosphatase
MKTLYLLRHAKSSWGDVSLPDRNRPLEARGERDAARMGKRWSQGNKKPDLIVASPATRALATARLVAHGLKLKSRDITIDERLYAASPDTLITVIEALDDQLERVMLVGHNPGLTELAHRFDRGIVHMSTCTLAEFRFDVASWVGIGRAWPVHTVFDSPKTSAT